MSDELIKPTCRTCLITEELELLDWNVEGFVEGFNYAQCFQEVTQLELSLELPPMLCYDCAFELRIAHSFIKRARKADQKLRSYIHNRTSKRSAERDARSISPTAALEEGAQSSPVFNGEVEMEDSIGKITEDALIDLSNVTSSEILANLTSVEQSNESISDGFAKDLESQAAELVLSQPTSQKLPEEAENQLQAPSTQQSLDLMQYEDAVNVLLCYIKAEEPKTTDHTISAIEEVMNDYIEATFENPQKNRKNLKFTCKICGSTFTTNYSLGRHQVIHDKPRQRAKPSLQCKFCKETFATKAKVTHHMDVAHGSRKWLCHVCSRAFTSNIGLRKHEATHEKRERKYSCEVCGTKCLTPEILRGHMKVHDKNRKPLFACDECDKTFFVRSGLVLHKRLHSGDTANCEICQRAFPRAVDLKIHMRSHSNERPYQCETCSSTFKTVAALNFHALRHKALQIKCEVCGKVYANVASLQKHRKDHDGVSHKCQVCEKAFYSKYKTLRHIKAVHSIQTSEEAEELVIYVKREKKLRPRLHVFITEK